MTLILELASGGELQRVIDEEERIEERMVKRYLRHILTALRFLHSHNIAHLDLKPQNLLLTGSHPDSDVKLCDFGISRVILADIEVKEILGTPDYVAPEILQYEPISLATDMWCRLTVSEALEHPWLSPSEISLPQPRLPTLQMKEEHDITLVSLKRSSSPSKVIVSNKENNRNLLNSSISPSGSSPPSKRECRESNESEPDIESSNHSTDLEVVSCIPPQSPRLPKHHHSPKIQSRTPTKDRGRVSKQIKCIEMRLKSTPPKNNLGDADESNVNGQKQSVASLKAKFTNQINLNISAMPSSRRNNLNKSFGSVDQPDGKEKVSEALRRYSPLCIRRDQNQSNSSDQTKYGSRSDFQDMVIRNGYIC
ncbi:Death-associated protein kinase related [Armadillidium vulgare]|nr:Death-associated protein kinase related [Armadillidium vulgare]